MQIAYHYLRLREHFSEVPQGRDIETTLGDVSAIICCTERNAKLVIKQLVSLQWIGWVPGKGRGNCSRITFLSKTEQIVLPLAQDFVAQGELEKAMSLLNDSRIPAEALDQFVAWLSGQFGFREETGRDKQSRDTLRMSFYRPIPSIDPAFVGRRTESHMVKQVFDTLVRYDKKSDSFQPHLAHHWESDETGCEWTFYLRKGVLFHHGRQLTAEDVVQTMKRIADPQTGSPYCWMLQDVEEATAVRETIVRIKLKRPNHLLLPILASDRLSIVPMEVVRQKGSLFAREPVGSGPFRLVTNDDRMFVLETFAAYFQGRAHLDRIEIWVVPESDLYREETQWIDGEVHLQPFRDINEPTIEKWNELQHVENGSQYLAFNLNRPGPVQLQTFREALDRVLDREKMIAELGGKGYMPAHGFLPEDSIAHDRQPPISRDETRTLLERSGYQGEALVLYTYEGAGNEKNAEWLQRHLQEAGVILDVKVVPIEELKLPETLEKADLLLAGEVFDEQVVLGIVEMYLSEGSFLRFLWDDTLRDRIDRKLDQLMRESVPARQFAYLSEVEACLKEQAAMLFLFHSRQRSAFRSALAGVSMTALGWVDYKDIWFKSTDR